jgi:hypothetical protein
MSLIIICLTGAANTGKTASIKEFASQDLRISKTLGGDLCGVWPAPYRNYLIAVNSAGDNLRQIMRGQELHFDRIRVMLVAARSEGETIEAVRKFAIETGAELHEIKTTKHTKPEDIVAAIQSNVREIRRLMPPARRLKKSA